jgi:hypothetical protein
MPQRLRRFWGFIFSSMSNHEILENSWSHFGNFEKNIVEHFIHNFTHAFWKRFTFQEGFFENLKKIMIEKNPSVITEAYDYWNQMLLSGEIQSQNKLFYFPN